MKILTWGTPDQPIPPDEVKTMIERLEAISPKPPLRCDWCHEHFKDGEPRIAFDGGIFHYACAAEHESGKPHPPAPATTGYGLWMVTASPFTKDQIKLEITTDPIKNAIAAKELMTMGLDLHAGRPRTPYDDDMATLRAVAADNEAAEAALSRIDDRVKEAGGDYEGWDYGEGHARFSYGGFMRFRRSLARDEGFDLELMPGFQLDDAAAYMRAQERDPANHPPIGKASEEAIKAAGETYRAEMLTWEEVDTPLAPLLHHSDCDGSLAPEECAQVEPRLREIVEGWTEASPDREAGIKLCDLMRHCADDNWHLVFG